MPQIQLTDFVEAAETKFGNFEVITKDGDTLTFLNPMRMSKAQRTALVNVFDLDKRVLSHPDDDTFDLYRASFEVAAKSPADYEKLVAAVGDVPATWQGLFREFEKQTEPEKA